MANFGKEIKGGVEGSSADNILCTPYACPAAGTATSITAWVKDRATTLKVKFAIYKVSDNSLIGYTEEWAVAMDYDNWKTLNIAWGGALEATDYYLCLWYEAATYYYYTAVTVASVYDAKDYDSFPATLDPTSWADHEISIYCTYTPGIETLRPNANGTNTGLFNSVGNQINNYSYVDEVIADEDTTYVKPAGAGATYDTYGLPNSGVGAGTINSVTVHCRGKGTGDPAMKLRCVCRTGGADFFGDLETLTANYAPYSKVWTVNPNTAPDAWTWAEIDALEAGVELTGGGSPPNCRCTQVWAVVDYGVPPVGGGAQNVVLAGTGMRVGGGGAQTIMIGFP